MKTSEKIIVDAHCVGFTENQRARIERGLESKTFTIRQGYIVCATCGGNCGQCGETDILGCDIPASMDCLVNNLAERSNWWARLKGWIK